MISLITSQRWNYRRPLIKIYYGHTIHVQLFNDQFYLTNLPSLMMKVIDHKCQSSPHNCNGFVWAPWFFANNKIIEINIIKSILELTSCTLPLKILSPCQVRSLRYDVMSGFVPSKSANYAICILSHLSQSFYFASYVSVFYGSLLVFSVYRCPDTN